MFSRSKNLSVVPVYKDVGKRSTVKNYGHVSLLSISSKILKKPVNNRLFDHLKHSLFLFSSVVLVLFVQVQNIR